MQNIAGCPGGTSRPRPYSGPFFAAGFAKAQHGTFGIQPYFRELRFFIFLLFFFLHE
jgi:hypothetical protein